MSSRLVPLLALACALGTGAASAQTPAIPVFDISVRVHTDDPALEIEGQVIVPARSSPVASVELQIDRRIADLEVSVASPSGSAGPAKLSTTGNAAVVAWATPAPAGSPVVLTFRYRIGANSARSFYIAGDGVLLSGESFRWYPLPSTNRRATGRLRFLAADGLTVAATGRRVATRDADGWVDFEVSDPTTFSFAAGRHEIYRSTGEPVIALHLLRARVRAEERLALIRRILTVLVEEFGRYPHPDLEVVEMPDAAMGGSGNGTSLEGFVAVSTDVIERASLLTLAHEISHQWWADCVFAIGPSTVLLTEAMANYGALRSVEALYGERAAAEVRWRGFPGDSLFAGGRGYLSLVRGGLDGPLTSQAVEGIVSGNKGMLVHDLLSRSLGRERFRTVLRRFVRDHAFQDTTWRAFVDALQASDAGISWFFKQWYDQGGVPTWTLTWTQDGSEVLGTITQSPPDFRADVDVVLRGAQTSDRHQIRIEGPRTDFAWRAGFPVVALEIDPDYKVPHDSADRTADVNAIAPLGQAYQAMRSGGGDFTATAIAVLRDAPAGAGRDFLLEALQAGDAFDRGEWEAARRHADAALASPGALPEVVPGLHYTQAALARKQGDNAAVERAALAALRADEALAVPTGWYLAARELLDEIGK